MVKIVAQDGLGTGLTLFADEFGSAAPIFGSPLSVTELQNQPYDSASTVYRFVISGHPTIVGASAVSAVGASSVDFIDVTYEGAGGINLLRFESIGITKTDMAGPNPVDLTDVTLNFVAKGRVSLIGDDILIGNAFGDWLEGLAGNDRLNGRAGDDALFGGDGDDTLIGGTGADLLDGGTGADLVSYSDATQAVVVKLANNGANSGAAAGDILVAVEGVGGSQFDDDLTGNAEDNRLFGGGGDDFVFGSTGNDLLKGNTGNDELLGGGGDDTLNGGDGDDVLDGGNGQDFLAGGNGDDVLDGGDGNDRLRGGADTDSLLGGEGSDYLDGGDGDDVLDGGDGNDIIIGGAGDDIIIGSAGLDQIDGGDGIDTLDFSQLGVGASVTGCSSGYACAFGALDASRSLNIEAYVGSDFDDHFDITVWDYDIMISAGAGSDCVDVTVYTNYYIQVYRATVYGGKGDDYLKITTGWIYGDEGNDTLEVANGGYPNKAYASAFGGDGDDVLIFTTGSASLSGGDGNDTFYLDGKYFDIYSYDVIDASGDAGSDLFISTGSQPNSVAGGDGSDQFEFHIGSNTTVTDWDNETLSFDIQALSIGSASEDQLYLQLIQSAVVENGNVVFTINNERGDVTTLSLLGMADPNHVLPYIEFF